MMSVRNATQIKDAILMGTCGVLLTTRTRFALQTARIRAMSPQLVTRLFGIPKTMSQAGLPDDKFLLCGKIRQGFGAPLVKKLESKHSTVY